MWRTQIKNQGFETGIVFEIILKKCFHLLIGCGGYLNMGLLGLDLLILVLGIFDKFLGIWFSHIGDTNWSGTQKLLWEFTIPIRNFSDWGIPNWVQLKIII